MMKKLEDLLGNNLSRADDKDYYSEIIRFEISTVPPIELFTLRNE